MMNLFANLFKKHPTFLYCLKLYFEAKSKSPITDATREKHRYFYINIESFLRDHKLLDLKVNEVRVRHMEDLKNYIVDQGNKLGYASRHIEHSRAAIDYAVMMELCKDNPIRPIKAIRDKTEEPVSLTEHEIAKLYSAKFTSKTFKLVRDLFLFQCYTGLSYGDLWSFEIIEYNGLQWVTEARNKTKKKYWSQFNDMAKLILSRYHYKLPHITNQAYNRTIKKIAFHLNIDKQLSSHNARKTFATVRYQQGYSLESIADQMGNSPEITRRHYITPGPDRVIKEMQRLSNTLFTAQ